MDIIQLGIASMLIVCLLFTYQVIGQSVEYILTRDRVDTVGMHLVIITCLLWGIFYYVTHI